MGSNVKRSQPMAPSPVPPDNADDADDAGIAAAAAAASAAAATAASEHETSPPARGRDKASRALGSSARTVSPLMVPVLWGLGSAAEVPTGLLPSKLLQFHSRATGGCIIRRMTPDAHPKWRLLAPELPELQEFRPAPVGFDGR